MQKTIANVNFGLLEKSKKAQRSHIFNSLREASFYQHLCGGKYIPSVTKKKAYGGKTKGEETKLREKLLKEGKAYYILNISDKATLNNGFRYIKELLLQYHNYAMYEAYEAMKCRNVRVYSAESMPVPFIRTICI